MSASVEVIRRGIKWRSENALDGERQYLICGGPGLPVIFRTKAKALEFIRSQYGYIADRPDLKREPHGWRMPVPVRVRVTVTEL